MRDATTNSRTSAAKIGKKTAAALAASAELQPPCTYAIAANRSAHVAPSIPTRAAKPFPTATIVSAFVKKHGEHAAKLARQAAAINGRDLRAFMKTSMAYRRVLNMVTV